MRSTAQSRTANGSNLGRTLQKDGEQRSAHPRSSSSPKLRRHTARIAVAARLAPRADRHRAKTEEQRSADHGGDIGCESTESINPSARKISSRPGLGTVTGSM